MYVNVNVNTNGGNKEFNGDRIHDSDATLGDSNLLNHERLLHIFVFFHWVSHMSWTFLAFPPEMPEPQSVTDFLLTPGRAAAVMARVIVLLYCHCNRLPTITGLTTLNCLMTPPPPTPATQLCCTCQHKT